MAKLSWFDNLQTALHLLPTIATGVAAVAQTIPSVTASDRRDMVLGAVAAVAKVGEAVPEVHVQLVSELIDVVLGILGKYKVVGTTTTSTVISTATPTVDPIIPLDPTSIPAPTPAQP